MMNERSQNSRHFTLNLQKTETPFLLTLLHTLFTDRPCPGSVFSRTCGRVFSRINSIVSDDVNSVYVNNLCSPAEVLVRYGIVIYCKSSLKINDP